METKKALDPWFVFGTAENLNLDSLRIQQVLELAIYFENRMLVSVKSNASRKDN